MAQSWWSRSFGRSIYSMIFGDNLADKNVAATIIGVMLVMTLCYMAAFRGRTELLTPLVNIVFVVVGFYFGSKREVANECGDREDAPPK